MNSPNSFRNADNHTYLLNYLQKRFPTGPPEAVQYIVKRAIEEMAPSRNRSILHGKCVAALKQYLVEED